MEVEFADDTYEQLYTDPGSGGGYAPGIVTAFRKRVQFIRYAKDERDIRNWKSLRLEKLKGNRSHQHSIRLNDKYRLIIELKGTGDEKVVIIVGIEDYH